MISAMEIGFALSAMLLALAYVSTLPQPKRVPVRARYVQRRRRQDV